MARLRPPKRTIELVQFDGMLGFITADQLLTADEKYWRQWRSKLTDGSRGDRKGYVAKCFLCEGRVYIYVVKSKSGEAPAFSHYEGEGDGCAWHIGRNLTPDEERKLQYRGEQESPLHHELCEDIYRFVSADARCTESTCNRRLYAFDGDKWKVPDVSATLTGVGRLTIELQLSKTFQTEISERTIFYNRERIGLIWVFHGKLPDKETLSTSLKDVIHRQRGNAFVLDYESRIASHEKRTLVLKGYLQKDAGFEPGRLVRLDELTIPAMGCMYLEDRLIPPMLSTLAAYRNKCESSLQDADAPDLTLFTDAELRILRCEFPGLRVNDQTLKFIATILSIIAHAKGAPKQFASRQPNVTAMLNTYLDPKKATGLAPYAAMLESLIAATASKSLLKGTIGEHIKRAKESYGKGPHFHVGIGMDSPEGRLLTKLVPEVFDVKPRAMLMDFESLPAWAQDQP